MSEWSDYYDKGVDADLYIRNLYGQREFLLAIIADGPKRVLEVGAGTGTMSVFLSQLGLAVTTLDNDPTILGQAKTIQARLGGKNQLVEGDAFRLPFPDNSFDIVFHQGLLEHFAPKQIHQLLQEGLRVAPTVWLSVPNNWYPRRDFGDEILLSKSAWEKILQPYRVVVSRNYSLKFFPKWYLPRVPIQYMAKLERHEPR